MNNVISWAQSLKISVLYNMSPCWLQVRLHKLLFEGFMPNLVFFELIMEIIMLCNNIQQKMYWNCNTKLVKIVIIYPILCNSVLCVEKLNKYCLELLSKRLVFSTRFCLKTTLWKVAIRTLNVIELLNTQMDFVFCPYSTFSVA